MTPNNSFKPNLFRYGKSVAEKACHAFASTTQVGLTQALDLMERHMDEPEKSALARLRWIDSKWPTVKWVLLTLGAFNLLSGASSYFRHNDQAFGIVAGLIGFVAIVIAIRDWKGNASRTLLLNLYKDK